MRSVPHVARCENTVRICLIWRLLLFNWLVMEKKYLNKNWHAQIYVLLVVKTACSLKSATTCFYMFFPFSLNTSSKLHFLQDFHVSIWIGQDFDACCAEAYVHLQDRHSIDGVASAAGEGLASDQALSCRLPVGSLQLIDITKLRKIIVGRSRHFRAYVSVRNLMSLNGHNLQLHIWSRMSY